MFAIEQMSLCDYFTNLDLDLPTVGKHLVHSTITQGGYLLGAFTDRAAQHPVGIIAVRIAASASVEYIFVAESFRDQAIATQLLKAATALVLSKDLDMIVARVIPENPFGDILEHLLLKTGFEQYSTATISRFDNVTSIPAWNKFMEQRGNRICTGLINKGYETISFAEANEEVLEKLKKAMIDSFPVNLNPFRLMAQREPKFVHDHSFITLKDGEPAAFAAVTTIDGKTLFFQQLAAGYKYQGRGAFLLPLASFVAKCSAEQRYHLASTLVYNGNDRMKILIDRFLQPLATSAKIQNSYRKKLGEISKVKL